MPGVHGRPHVALHAGTVVPDLVSRIASDASLTAGQVRRLRTRGGPVAASELMRAEARSAWATDLNRASRNQLISWLREVGTFRSAA